MKAAEELQYAPSTVTLQIQRLEADLGVSLFVRDGKRVIVTEAGRWLYHEASALLNSIGAMRQTVSDIATGVNGSVRFSSIEPVASQQLAAVIARFCKTRPKVQLTMEVGGSRSIAERVRAGELDFGVCSAPPSKLMLEFEPLFEERLGVMLNMNHPLADRDSIKASDLARHTILVKEPTCIYRELWETAIYGLSKTCSLVWRLEAFCYSTNGQGRARYRNCSDIQRVGTGRLLGHTTYSRFESCHYDRHHL